MRELDSPYAGQESRADVKPDARLRVHDAALLSFSRYGRSGARIDEIVRLSGVNVRMIYHHFGSKDGLYDEILAEAVRSRTSALKAAKSVSLSWGLLDLILAAISWQSSHPVYRRILDWESCENWSGCSAALESQTEAPDELQPCDHDGSFLLLQRRLHRLASPWAAEELHGSAPQHGLLDRAAQLIEESLKCFDAQAQ